MTTNRRPTNDVVRWKLLEALAVSGRPQSDLAAVLNMSPSACRLRLKGKRLFTLLDLDTIARWLGCTVAHLVDDDVTAEVTWPRGATAYTGQGERE